MDAASCIDGYTSRHTLHVCRNMGETNCDKVLPLRWPLVKLILRHRGLEDFRPASVAVYCTSLPHSGRCFSPHPPQRNSTFSTVQRLEQQGKPILFWIAQHTGHTWTPTAKGASGFGNGPFTMGQSKQSRTYPGADASRLAVQEFCIFCSAPAATNLRAETHQPTIALVLLPVPCPARPPHH